MSSREAADAARQGRTGLSPFEISPRTVRDIVGQMEAEADRKLPATVLDLEGTEAMERAPGRAARIVEAELSRLEGKAEKGGLTEKELDRLPKLARYSNQIAKLLEGRGPPKPRSGPTGRRAKERGAPESVIERIAREQAEREQGEAVPSSTRTDHADDDSPPDAPPQTPGSALPAASPAPPGPESNGSSNGAEPDGTDASPPGPTERALAQRSPEERAEIARKARAALAGA